MWLQVELPQTSLVEGLKLKYAASKNDGPDGYMVSLSKDGKMWGGVAATGLAGEKERNLAFVPMEARFLRIEIREVTKNLFWSIHELEVFGWEM